MPDRMIIVTNDLQGQGIARLEVALHKQNKNIRRLANAGLLLVAMGLVLQRQIDILNNKEKKNE